MSLHSSPQPEPRQSNKYIKKFNNKKSKLFSFLFPFALAALMCFVNDSVLYANSHFPDISLPENAQGEQAIKVLGNKLPEVAAWYGSTPQEFAAMLRNDHTAWVDINGRLFFVDEFPEPAVGDDVPSIDAAFFPYDQTFKLHSRPGSKRVIFLDFDGNTTTGTAWNSSYGEPINSPAYDFDGDNSSFSNAEMDRIQNVWQLVAEDYAPFDVDITTEDPGQDAIIRSSSSDDRYGSHVVMTVDDFANCGCGGFAYVGVYDNVGSTYKPAFVFNSGEVGMAEAISHEAGHNLGLSHDGIIGGTSYYQGHGNGDTGWAPIMGVGYYQKLVQWSKGEYTDANNTQDDIQIIQNNGAILMADDHGNNQASATELGKTSDGVTVTLNGNGLVEQRTDVDFFSFISGNGDISININPAQLSPNLDILAELHDATGSLIASSNPVDGLSAPINVPALAAGEYFILVDGIGKGDPLGTGYSDYASIGQYTISGSIPDPDGLQSPVSIAAATPLSGNVPLTVSFTDDGSYDQDGTIVSYEWHFGDNTVSSPNATSSHTYYAPGNYTATLTVTDNDGLASSDTVSIVVKNGAPVAVAIADLTEGTAPLTLSFDSTASYDPDAPYGSITSYHWDFGDGNSSTTASPSHTYNTAGSFLSTLTVTDDFGDNGTATVQITVSPSPTINQYSTSENYVAGNVSGSYINTFANDGANESIMERESGGKPSNRYSYLEHIWIIPVQAGNSATLFVNAWQSTSEDSDAFVFAYSTDRGVTYNEAVIISETTDSDVVSAPLPPSIQGDIYIRVQDTNRKKGNRALDSIFVDELYIMTENQPGNPPLAPTDLTANAVSSGLIDLSWVDVIDENGFNIERSTDNGISWSLITIVAANVQSYSDTNVAPATTYWYRISAYNGSGQSDYYGSDGTVSATTYQVVIELLANRFKEKGVNKVDLTWNSTTGEDIEINRDNFLIGTSNNGAYTDSVGKGGGSYTYQIYEPSSENYSNIVTVTF